MPECVLGCVCWVGVSQVRLSSFSWGQHLSVWAVSPQRVTVPLCQAPESSAWGADPSPPCTPRPGPPRAWPESGPFLKLWWFKVSPARPRPAPPAASSHLLPISCLRLGDQSPGGYKLLFCAHKSPGVTRERASLAPWLWAGAQESAFPTSSWGGWRACALSCVALKGPLSSPEAGWTGSAGTMGTDALGRPLSAALHGRVGITATVAPWGNRGSVRLSSCSQSHDNW